MKSQSKKLRVVVVDDDDGFLKACRKTLTSCSTAVALAVKDNDRAATVAALQTMEDARTGLRHGAGRPSRTPNTLFDDADIVFVDYDLIDLQRSTTLTGEDIAYLLRCFTTCGLIVLLNPPDLGTSFFDLGLRRPIDSWADLALGVQQLSNTWLWTEKKTGFAPWEWPNLVDAVKRRRAQVREAGNSLDVPILDVVQIPADARIGMDHTMAETVSLQRRKASSGTETPRWGCHTIREFVLNPMHGIRRKDAENGRVAADSKTIARIGAARISAWLEQTVLPAQSVLVDAPHLLARLPGLMTGVVKSRSAWNASAVRGIQQARPCVREQLVRRARYAGEKWLSRPAWLWPVLAADGRFLKWTEVDCIPDLVFCEDTSSFVSRSDAREFMADVPAQYALRYVAMPGGTHAPSAAQYRPSVRLSM